MSEDAESKTHAGRWVVGVVVALVLYVFSIGPVSALAWKYEVSQTAWNIIRGFYKPLFIGRERLGAHDLMGTYCSWWLKVFHVSALR